MIDLSEFPVGQRFRTRGGYVTTLLPSRAGGLYWLSCEDGHTSGFDKFGIGNAVSYPYEPARPIVPARTRRLPKPLPMPTGYQRQWPHLYQYGGQV